uniref:Uncharacterized protein n=1 Tax=Oryza rufipogon TaxID=4529 RepID=A0A0E0Q765_ORYRU
MRRRSPSPSHATAVPVPSRRATFPVPSHAAAIPVPSHPAELNYASAAHHLQRRGGRHRGAIAKQRRGDEGVEVSTQR